MIMIFTTLPDFHSIMLSPPDPMREVVLGDAWERSKLPIYDHFTCREFKDAMKKECEHYFAAPVAADKNNALLYSRIAQSEAVKELGADTVAEILRAEGLKLGQVRPAPVVDPATQFKDATTNPYLPGFKGDREAKIASIIRTDHKLAERLAKAAGKNLVGQALQPVGAARMKR
jgi:hypothetical protein